MQMPDAALRPPLSGMDHLPREGGTQASRQTVQTCVICNFGCGESSVEVRGREAG